MQIKVSKSLDYRRASLLPQMQSIFFLSEVISFRYNIKLFYLKPSDYTEAIWDTKNIKHESLVEILITAVNQNQTEQ